MTAISSQHSHNEREPQPHEQPPLRQIGRAQPEAKKPVQVSRRQRRAYRQSGLENQLSGDY